MYTSTIRLDESNTMTLQNDFEKVSSTTTITKSDSAFNLEHLETGLSTLTEDKRSFTVSLLIVENTSNSDHWPQNHGSKKKDKGRVFPMKGFIKNLPTSISRSNKKKFLDAPPKDGSADNSKEATDYPDIELPQCGNCKTLSDLLAVNEFTITELKNARQEDAEKFTTIENQLKATIARLINASKENELQNGDAENLIQESQKLLFKENSNHVYQIDSLVKKIEDLTLKLKTLREKSEAQESENEFLKNQVEMHKCSVKDFTKTRVMTLIGPAPSSFTRTHIQEVYTKESITCEAFAQTEKVTSLCSRQLSTEHAVLNNSSKTKNSSVAKILNEPEATNATETPFENPNNLQKSRELKNEKKTNPEDDGHPDKEASSIRSSKKKSAFKSLINKTSEMIKLSYQQASVGQLEKRKELGLSKPVKDENEEIAGTRDIQNGASLDHYYIVVKGSCARKDSVKQNFSNLEKESNKIHELKSNIASNSQLHNARYSANENDALQKKHDQPVHMQGLHSNNTKNSSRLKSVVKESPRIKNTNLKKGVETIRKETCLTESPKVKLIPNNESLKQKNSKKLNKNYKHLGLTYSFFKQKKSLENRNGQSKDHPPLAFSSTITRETGQKKKSISAVKKSASNEQSKSISNPFQPVTKIHAETKMRLGISPTNADPAVTPRNSNSGIRRISLEKKTQINQRDHGDTDSSRNKSFETNVARSSVGRLRLNSTKDKESNTLRPLRISSNRKSRLTYVLPSIRKNMRSTTPPLTKKSLPSDISVLNCTNQDAFKVIQDVLLVNLISSNSVYHTVQHGTTSTDIICFVKQPFHKVFFEWKALTKTKDNLEETVLFLQNLIKFIKKIYSAFFEVTKDKDLILKEKNLVVCVELFLSKAMLLHKNSASTFSNQQRIQELQTFLALEREEHQEKITRLQRQLNKAQNELIQFKEGMAYNPTVYCAASNLSLRKFMMHD